MPHLVRIGLTEAVIAAVLDEPVVGIRRSDVYCLSADMLGQTRGVHPLGRFVHAAVRGYGVVEQSLLVCG